MIRFDKQRNLGTFNTRQLAEQAFDLFYDKVQHKEHTHKDAESIDRLVNEVRSTIMRQPRSSDFSNTLNACSL